MINSIGNGHQALHTQSTVNNNTVTETKRVLRMVKNERMGGMMPKWETITVTKAQDIEQALASTEAKAPSDTFQSALADQSAQNRPPEEAPEEFGFSDLIDMVNPLHHIPIISHFYRNMTGDEIRPVGKIIGGALFGGPLGAASNLVNTIIQKETGKNLAENAISLALNGKKPDFKTTPDENAHPEKILNKIARETNNNDLPASLLAFTNNGNENIHIENRSAAGGRTAGVMSHTIRSNLNIEMLLTRDPITEVILRRMPDKY